MRQPQLSQLAVRYGLLAGGADALVAAVVSLVPLGRYALLDAAFGLVSLAVLAGSVYLVARIGYLSRMHRGVIGAAAGPGAMVGILFGLGNNVGSLLHMARSGQLLQLEALGAGTFTTGLAFGALLILIVLAFIGMGLALLGAAVAQKRAGA